eukprot:Hpha_TRINITY_DN15227_c1_g1::TRINITY_DN15227_c1_g1_i8::g.65294::m.65294
MLACRGSTRAAAGCGALLLALLCAVGKAGASAPRLADSPLDEDIAPSDEDLVPSEGTEPTNSPIPPLPTSPPSSLLPSVAPTSSLEMAPPNVTEARRLLSLIEGTPVAGIFCQTATVNAGEAGWLTLNLVFFGDVSSATSTFRAELIVELASLLSVAPQQLTIDQVTAASFRVVISVRPANIPAPPPPPPCPPPSPPPPTVGPYAPGTPPGTPSKAPSLPPAPFTTVPSGREDLVDAPEDAPEDAKDRTAEPIPGGDGLPDWVIVIIIIGAVGVMGAGVAGTVSMCRRRDRTSGVNVAPSDPGKTAPPPVSEDPDASAPVSKHPSSVPGTTNSWRLGHIVEAPKGKNPLDTVQSDETAPALQSQFGNLGEEESPTAATAEVPGAVAGAPTVTTATASAGAVVGASADEAAAGGGGAVPKKKRNRKRPDRPASGEAQKAPPAPVNL